MPSNNFKIFDENKQNILSDEEYNINTQRTNGVQAGIASSKLNNKFSYQVSLMAYALAQLMIKNGIDALDSAEANAFVDNLGSALLQKVVDKANKVLAEAGEDDTKWMTPLQAKNAIFTLATKAPNILADSTKEIFGLDQSATVNDVFVVLGLGAGKYGYGITLKYPDGTPAAGLKVTGVTDRLGQAITTDENGYFLAVATTTSIKFSVNQEYFDINNITNKTINSTSVVTNQEVSFEYKTITNYVLLQTSQQLKFSRACKLDLTAVGGGGGSTGVSTKARFGAGGGGGFVQTLLDIDVSTSDIIKLTIGSGGSILYMESTADGYDGGVTKVEKNNVQLLLANGGGGSGYNNSTSTASKGIGNGNGGLSAGQENPTNGAGYIFNNSSLGIAGGGGGGAFVAYTRAEGAVAMKGGLPNGANGGLFISDTATLQDATTPGIGGGGGGGGAQQLSYKVNASAGGKGCVYLKFEYV